MNIPPRSRRPERQGAQAGRQCRIEFGPGPRLGLQCAAGSARRRKSGIKWKRETVGPGGTRLHTRVHVLLDREVVSCLGGPRPFGAPGVGWMLAWHMPVGSQGRPATPATRVVRRRPSDGRQRPSASRPHGIRRLARTGTPGAGPRSSATSRVLFLWPPCSATRRRIPAFPASVGPRTRGHRTHFPNQGRTGGGPWPHLVRSPTQPSPRPPLLQLACADRVRPLPRGRQAPLSACGDPLCPHGVPRPRSTKEGIQARPALRAAPAGPATGNFPAGCGSLMVSSRRRGERTGGVSVSARRVCGRGPQGSAGAATGRCRSWGSLPAGLGDCAELGSSLPVRAAGQPTAGPRCPRPPPHGTLLFATYPGRPCAGERSASRAAAASRGHGIRGNREGIASSRPLIPGCPVSMYLTTT